MLCFYIWLLWLLIWTLIYLDIDCVLCHLWSQVWFNTKLQLKEWKCHVKVLREVGYYYCMMKLICILNLYTLLKIFYYPVMPCVSVVFAVTRGPSITFMYCIQTAENIVKLRSRSSCPIILVFWPWVLVPNSKGNPFSRGAKYMGVGKICSFWLKSPFISETVQDRPMVAMGP